jgi:hypothetical protein
MNVLDVSSTHMDEGDSYTLVKIAFALPKIIEIKIAASLLPPAYRPPVASSGPA